MTDTVSTNIMERNSRDYSEALIIPPSFLCDLSLIDRIHEFINPLRKEGDEDMAEASKSLEMDFKGQKTTDRNWLESAFYSLYDDYVGARGGLYETRNVVLADRNKNRLMGFGAGVYYGPAEGGGMSSDLCNENSIVAISDSLYEFKTTSEFDQATLNSSITIAPYYHYLAVKDGKLFAMNSNRMFPCTQFVKLNDSYLNGCYVVDNKAIDHVTPEILRYMKNEIFASYGYKFKNLKWRETFQMRFDDYYGYDSDTTKLKDNVNSSLTAIDKYNINWIDQKLKQQQAGQLAANK
jgi:hypothetical protein